MFFVRGLKREVNPRVSLYYLWPYPGVTGSQFLTRLYVCSGRMQILSEHMQILFHYTIKKRGNLHLFIVTCIKYFGFYGLRYLECINESILKCSDHHVQQVPVEVRFSREEVCQWQRGLANPNLTLIIVRGHPRFWIGLGLGSTGETNSMKQRILLKLGDYNRFGRQPLHLSENLTSVMAAVASPATVQQPKTNSRKQSCMQM